MRNKEYLFFIYIVTLLLVIFSIDIYDFGSNRL